MSDFDLACLKLDIQKNGQRNPIILHDGKIIDGQNRLLACQQLDIDPLFREFIGNDVAAYVLSVNLHRRHLTSGQQAAIVASVQDWEKAQKVGNPQLVTSNQLADSVASRAKQANVGISTQKKADAVARANPELAAQVARGEVSLNDATREVSPQLAPKKKEVAPEPVAKSYPQEEPDEQVMLIDALESTVEFLTAENERLSDKNLIDGSPEDRRIETAELIASLRFENKSLKINYDAVVKSRDALLNENASLKKQDKISQSRIKKLEAKLAGKIQ
jgi:FtsZ-binding cell division protein ZapB